MIPPLPDTPIRAALPELRAALARQRNVVLEAPPGAGKSTVVPLALLDEPWLAGQRLIMLQPRRIAARAVARRLSQLAGCEPGQLVGYRTRLETRVSAATRIEVVTEGILTRRLQSDAALEGVGCVIFDEFHERNLQSDLGLALVLDVQRHLRDDLRVLVMSATLDGLAVARVLGDAAIVRSAGRAYDVVTHYSAPLPASVNRWPEPIEQRAARAVLRALATDPGDVLVFLPGAAEIRRCCRCDRRGCRRSIAAGAAAVRRPRCRDPGCRPAAGAAGPSQGRGRHQPGRDQPDDRRRAHRGRRRAGAAPALRSQLRHESTGNRIDIARIGRPAARTRRPHRPGRVLPAVVRIAARGAGGSHAAGHARSRPGATGAGTRLLGQHRSCGAALARPAATSHPRAGARVAAASRGARCARPGHGAGTAHGSARHASAARSHDRARVAAGSRCPGLRPGRPAERARRVARARHAAGSRPAPSRRCPARRSSAARPGDRPARAAAGPSLQRAVLPATRAGCGAGACAGASGRRARRRCRTAAGLCLPGPDRTAATGRAAALPAGPGSWRSAAGAFRAGAQRDHRRGRTRRG